MEEAEEEEGGGEWMERWAEESREEAEKEEGEAAEVEERERRLCSV